MNGDDQSGHQNESHGVEMLAAQPRTALQPVHAGHDYHDVHNQDENLGRVDHSAHGPSAIHPHLTAHQPHAPHAEASGHSMDDLDHVSHI